MKNLVQQLVSQALDQLVADGVVPADQAPVPVIERTRDSSHGDFASNLALVLAKAARTRPRDLAERLVAALPASPRVEKVEIAGPGFINFHLAPVAYHELIPRILEQGHQFGRSDLGGGR
ncbi:MAG TPA: arginine--tRNA ligase, partial [Sedimenticola thiotaurini]|nr:arginine--tRNA ligase [Sedimenticola thiotaurini]